MNSRKFLNDLETDIEENNCALGFHTMFAGGCLCALMLLCREEDPNTFQAVISNTSCQVMDSPFVGHFGEMADGIAYSITNSSVMIALLKGMILAYFWQPVNTMSVATTKLFKTLKTICQLYQLHLSHLTTIH